MCETRSVTLACCRGPLPLGGARGALSTPCSSSAHETHVSSPSEGEGRGVTRGKRCLKLGRRVRDSCGDTHTHSPQAVGPEQSDGRHLGSQMGSTTSCNTPKLPLPLPSKSVFVSVFGLVSFESSPSFRQRLVSLVTLVSESSHWCVCRNIIRVFFHSV